MLGFEHLSLSLRRVLPPPRFGGFVLLYPTHPVAPLPGHEPRERCIEIRLTQGALWCRLSVRWNTCRWRKHGLYSTPCLRRLRGSKRSCRWGEEAITMPWPSSEAPPFLPFRCYFAADLPCCFGFLLTPQLMVGSRYHELIESADSIVSMKETSMEVLDLLRSFPHACSNVLQQVRKC